MTAILLRDGKARAPRRRKIVAAPPLRPRRSRSLGSPPKKAGWVRHQRTDLPMPGATTPIPSRPSSALVKTSLVGLAQLIDDPFSERRRSMLMQVVVEIAQRRDEREQFDPGDLCTVGQY